MKSLFLAGIFSLTATLIVAFPVHSYYCTFEKDTCGFTNEEEQDSNWIRAELELGGRKGYVMTLDSKETEEHLSRLITPYLEIHGESEACLTFDYYVFGSGLKALFVLEQNTNQITGIWDACNTKRLGWRKVQEEVHVDKDTRFFFGARVDPSIGRSKTVVAITNVGLKLSKC